MQQMALDTRGSAEVTHTSKWGGVGHSGADMNPQATSGLHKQASMEDIIHKPEPYTRNAWREEDLFFFFMTRKSYIHIKRERAQS